MSTKTPVKTRNRNPKVDPADLWPNNLAEVRKLRGRSMTQARLAELVSEQGDHVGQTTIAAIETGRISGRKYMHKIAAILGVDVKEIFPHAAFSSVSEAAEAVGAKPTQIYRSGVPMFKIKGTNFVKMEDVLGTPLKKRVGPSLREQMHYFLNEEGPMTVGELTDQFGPFANNEERDKRKNTVQVLLSRSPEFLADRSTYPARWRFSQRKLTMSRNGTL